MIAEIYYFIQITLKKYRNCTEDEAYDKYNQLLAKHKYIVPNFIFDHPYLNPSCNYCHEKSNDLKKCGSCKKAKYCNIECQKNDWVNHKKNCCFIKN